MEAVPLDRVAERAGEVLTVEIGLDEEVLRPGAHRLQPVSLIDRIGEKEERDRGCQRPQLGEGGEAATGGKRHSEEDDVDSAPRQSRERRLRLGRYHAEAVRVSAFQQLPDLPCGVLLTAHHQHDELVAARFRLAPAGGLAPIGGPASLGLVAPLLVERDDLQAALGLLTYAQDQGLLLDVDRWLLGTAIARLRVAMEQLGEGTGDAV